MRRYPSHAVQLKQCARVRTVGSGRLHSLLTPDNNLMRALRTLRRPRREYPICALAIRVSLCLHIDWSSYDSDRLNSALALHSEQPGGRKRDADARPMPRLRIDCDITAEYLYPLYHS